MEYVEVARADDARGEVVLRRRTDDNAVDVFEVRVNGVYVMDTLETSTEHALAEVALGDDEEGEAAGGTGRVVAVVEVGGGFCGDVDEEFGLVDCFVGAGCVGEFGEDEGDERGGVGGGGGGVLG